MQDVVQCGEDLSRDVGPARWGSAAGAGTPPSLAVEQWAAGRARAPRAAMESGRRGRPQQRRSRVARLASEQQRTHEAGPGARPRGVAEKRAGVPYAHVYPTLPGKLSSCRCESELRELSNLITAEVPGTELAPSALLATAAEIESRRQDMAALAEVFPAEHAERLQEVLLRTGGLHAAVAEIMESDSAGTQHVRATDTPAAQTQATAHSTSSEALPWLLSLFDEQIDTTTVQHVLACAAGDFDVALDTLGELVAAAERTSLSVEEYLELIAAQASDATAAAQDEARGQQASEDCARQLLREDKIAADCQRLLSKVALGAPAAARRRRDAQQAAIPSSTGRDPPARRPAQQLDRNDAEQVQLDLHGLSVESGIEALDEQLRRIKQLEPLCRGRRRRLLVVTGRGSHSAGPAGRAPVRAAVDRHLSAAGISFTEAHGGGAFEVRL